MENCFGKKKQTKTIIIFNEKQSYHQQTVMAKVKKQEIEKNKKLTWPEVSRNNNTKQNKTISLSFI